MDLSCSKCNQLKPEAAFAKCSRSRTGRQRWCKDCTKVYGFVRYQERQKSISVPASKICYECNKTLPASSFHLWAISKDGLRARCRDCCSIVNRAKKYRLSNDDVTAILTVPCCQSCGQEFSEDAEVHFDHCPHSGLFRGVLCRHCNTSAGAGCVRQVERLRNLISYLERHHEQG